MPDDEGGAANDDVQDVVDALQRHDPQVQPELIAKLVGQVAPGPRTRKDLLTYLREHPDVVTQGGSRMPKVVGELLYAAIAAGVKGVVSPACASCARPRTLFHNTADGQRICPSCYNRTRRAICSVCGQERHVAGKSSEGGALCGTCRNAGKPDGECAGCGRVMQVRRSKDGLEYCRRCASRRAPTESCASCGRVTRVNARQPDGTGLCSNCYTKERQTTATCDACGQSAALVARKGGRGGHDRNLCGRCYRHPHRECGLCGRTRRVALRATETSPDVCPTCYWAPVVLCATCGQEGLGRRTTNDGDPWCFACQAATRVDEFLADEHGHLRLGYAPVREALLEMDPRSVLHNWGRVECFRLLGDLLTEHGEVTHELLDAEPQAFSVHYLRGVLVSAGLLNERDEYLARLRVFCQDVVAEVDQVSERQVLARYAQWYVIARLQIGPGGLTANQAYNARSEVRSAQRFIAFLSLRGVGVRDCRQRDIEEWALEGRSLHFVRWLKRQRFLPASVAITTPSVAASAQTGDPDDQLELARRLLHDPSIAGVEERVAGTLVLLYAQPLARIARLTLEDLTEDRGRMQLKLGEHPLDVPPVLADLLRQLPVRKPFGAARELADKQWLFPGKRAGQPRHAGSLIRALRPLGIPARVSRNTALLHLATSVPPAVIANALGIDTNTAQKWAEVAGSSWSGYGPSRPRDVNQGPVIDV